MALTAQAQVQDMIERATRLGDDVLASEIRAFAASRQFGLVFEHNRPERMRLYGKPVSVGDVVQVLPERGKAEGAASKLLWRVDAIAGTTAELSAYKTQSYAENNEEPRSAQLEDLVAVAEYDQPIYAGLRETGRVERGGDKPYQVVINGENYHALESLLFCYAGKVDCIYIDPPYNKEDAHDWKYNNNYVDGNDAYRHSKWLAMMERRLKLAKQLLNHDKSVLICTIDEKEYLRLGLLLEQVFSDATIQMVSSVINPKGVAQKNGFRRADEYLFFVMLGNAKPARLQLGNEWSASAKKAAKADDKKKVKIGWTSMMRRGSHSHRIERKGLYYPIYADPEQRKIIEVGEVVPAGSHSGPEIEGLVQILPIRTDGSEGCWQVEPSELCSRISQGRVRLGSKTSYGFVVNYLPDGEFEKIANGLFEVVGYADDGSIIAESKEALDLSIAPTQWKISSHNATEYGTGLISEMIGRDFTYPKSLYAVEDSLRFFVKENRDALVVDFFSGSGTTAHAVMRLNRQDSGKRRCICITNNELSESEEKRLTEEGSRKGDPEWERLGICEYITKPRIEAAITGFSPEGEPIKGDYKFIDEFPISDGFEENAIFFDLTYQNPDAVELGTAFEEVAPLLWLRAGARGSMIKHEEPGYAIADTYAVLFDYSYVRDFVPAVLSTPNISCAFIVTDDPSRFASVKKELGSMECVRLYESYLRSFRIAAEDAVR